MIDVESCSMGIWRGTGTWISRTLHRKAQKRKKEKKISKGIPSRRLARIVLQKKTPRRAFIRLVALVTLGTTVSQRRTRLTTEKTPQKNRLSAVRLYFDHVHNKVAAVIALDHFHSTRHTMGLLVIPERKKKKKEETHH